MKMPWNMLRTRVWLTSGMALMAVGGMAVTLVPSLLYAQQQQDVAREQQRLADTKRDELESEDRLARQREQYEAVLRQQQAAEREQKAAERAALDLRAQARKLEGQAQAAQRYADAADVSSQSAVFSGQMAADSDRAAEALANTIARMQAQSDASRAGLRYRRSASLANANDSERKAWLQQYAQAKRDKHPESQQEARERLLELTRREFEAIEKDRQAEIEAIEERLTKLKAVMQERAEKAELIIELRVKRLLGEPTILDWNASSLPSGRYFEGVPVDLAAEGYDDGVDTIEVEGTVNATMHDESPMLEDLEAPADANVSEDEVALNAEQILKRLREKESQLGNVGVGMAGVYSLRRDAQTAWSDAREEMAKLRAEWEAMEAGEKLFKDKGVTPSAEFLARRAEIGRKFQILEEQGRKLSEASEDWRRKVEAGEASLRELQSEVDRLKGRVEQLRSQKIGVEQEKP